MLSRESLHWSFMDILYILTVARYMNYIWLRSIVIICSGDVEMNPDPMLLSCHSFSLSHWNVSSFSAHNFVKVTPLWAYVTFNKFNIICLSETYLDSSVLSNDTNSDLTDYLLRADHPSNTKRVVFVSTSRTIFLWSCNRRQKVQFQFFM